MKENILHSTSRNRKMGISGIFFVILLSLYFRPYGSQARFISIFYESCEDKQTLDVCNEEISFRLLYSSLEISRLRLLNMCCKILQDRPFRNFRNLQHLSWMHGRLEILRKSSFEDLETIQELVLKDNRIRSVDDSVFSPLINLQYLVLSRNNLTEEMLTIALRNVSSTLERLELDNLVISEIPFAAMEHLTTTNLRELSFAENRALQRIPDDSFPYLPYLTKLNFRKCSISELEDLAFVNLTSLEELDLSFSFLTSLCPAIYTITTLKTLLISGSKQEFVIPQRVFENLTALETLNLDHLKIKRLTPLTLRGLFNLKVLRLNGNSGMKVDEYAFETLNNLRQLELSFCNLSDFPTNLFYGLRNLEMLHLQRVHIELRPGHYDRFQHMPNLSVLQLLFNKLSNMSDFDLSFFPKLTDLTLYSNSISHWPKTFLADKANITLKLLQVEETLLGNVTPAMLADFEKLKEIAFFPFPFKPSCSSCGIFAFSLWLQTTNVSVINRDSLECDPTGTSIKELTHLPVPANCNLSLFPIPSRGN